LGYLGAIVGLILVMPFNQGSVFGLTIPFIKGGGRAATFVPTGLLFLFFSLPAFFFLRDQASSQVARTRVSWGRSLRQVLEVLEHSSRYPGVIRFLLAKFFYENAISAVIIFMAVYAVKAMGFSDAVVMPFFIVSTASAVVGSTICGTITDRLGPLRTLKVVLVGWMASLCLVLITSNQWIFWGVGSLVGIFLGATWTTARPLLVTMVPEKMLGEFFGLYAFSGKAAAIFGPLIWGLVVMIFQEHEVLKYKLAVGSMVLLIGVGLAVLWQLPRERAKESA
jgi:UMF1 family MFS transporter